QVGGAAVYGAWIGGRRGPGGVERVPRLKGPTKLGEVLYRRGSGRDEVAKAISFRGVDVAIPGELAPHDREDLRRTRGIARAWRPLRREPHVHVLVRYHSGHRMLGSHRGVFVGMLLRRRHVLVVGGGATPVAGGGKDI